MKNTSRQIRRFHITRLKHKRKNYYGYNRVYGKESVVKMTPRALGMAIHSVANCSCASCGNPRKHFGTRTIQEISFMQTLNFI